MTSMRCIFEAWWASLAWASLRWHSHESGLGHEIHSERRHGGDEFCHGGDGLWTVRLPISLAILHVTDAATNANIPSLFCCELVLLFVVNTEAKNEFSFLTCNLMVALSSQA